MKRNIQGLKVLSIALNLPGPFLCHRLTQFGGAITKIEPPQGDPLKHHFPEYYKKLNVRQKVLTIDLKDSKGLESFYALLKKSDLLITSSRPDSLAKLGLGWKALHRKFPKLSVLALLSYPGKRANLAGHDLNFQAETGLIRPPAMPVTTFADIAGAQEALIQVLSGIPMGKRVEVALSEALTPFQDPIRYGLCGASDRMLGGALPVYGIYPALDGWIALAALEPHLAKRLQEESGMEELTSENLRQLFQTRSARDWENWGAERGIPISGIRELP